MRFVDEQQRLEFRLEVGNRRQIAEIAITEYGLDPSKVRYEYTGGDRGWKGDVPVVRFDVSKIKALGWRAKRTSIQAVRDAIQAMINDPSHP